MIDRTMSYILDLLRSQTLFSQKVFTIKSYKNKITTYCNAIQYYKILQWNLNIDRNKYFIEIELIRWDLNMSLVTVARLLKQGRTCTNIKCALMRNTRPKYFTFKLLGYSSYFSTLI